jgi:hypothetical protein
MACDAAPYIKVALRDELLGTATFFTKGGMTVKQMMRSMGPKVEWESHGIPFPPYGTITVTVSTHAEENPASILLFSYEKLLDGPLLDESRMDDEGDGDRFAISFGPEALFNIVFRLRSVENGNEVTSVHLDMAPRFAAVLCTWASLGNDKDDNNDDDNGGVRDLPSEASYGGATRMREEQSVPGLSRLMKLSGRKIPAQDYESWMKLIRPNCVSITEPFEGGTPCDARWVRAAGMVIKLHPPMSQRDACRLLATTANGKAVDAVSETKEMCDTISLLTDTRLRSFCMQWKLMAGMRSVSSVDHMAVTEGVPGWRSEWHDWLEESENNMDVTLSTSNEDMRG